MGPKKRVPKLKLGTQKPAQNREAPAGLTDEADLHFSSGQVVHVKADELTFERDLGRGTFGLVTERLYEPLNIKIAVKHIRQQDEPAVSSFFAGSLKLAVIFFYLSFNNKYLMIRHL